MAYLYDADGLTTRAGDLIISRDTSGRVAGTTLGVTADSILYNPFAEPETYAATVLGNPVFAQAFQRDKLGRITVKTETVEGVTHVFAYTYDDAGRLERVIKDGQSTAAYTYDTNGNRLSHTDENGVVTTADYDGQDRLLRYGDTSYTWSNHGDLQSKTDASGTTTYVYDELGNLLSVTLPDARVVEYQVDARGRRVAKKVNGVLTNAWLYESQLRIAAELDGAGSTTGIFVYSGSPNSPDYAVKGTNTYRVLKDQVGTPRVVVDVASGTVAARLEADEFGVVVLENPVGFAPQGFAGGTRDNDAGLVRFGARDYEPLSGRWVSKDPLLFGGGDTNLFGYAANDPVNGFDASGLTVYLCTRVADLPGNSILGVTHHFIQTDACAGGMGPAGGPPPGHGGVDLPGSQTSMVDHEGEASRSNVMCTEVEDIDELCVNAQVCVCRSTGRWSPWNQCHSIAAEALDRCRTPKKKKLACQ